MKIKNLILEPMIDSRNLNEEIFNRITADTSINIYYRLNLKSRTLNEFKKELKIYERFPYILSVETPNKEIQIQAAKDSRIDILSFSNEKLLRTISPGIISLIKQNKSFIEFSLAPMMFKSKTQQSKNLRNLYILTKMVLKSKLNYIISGNFKESYHLRHPRNLVSVCHTLLGMPLNAAKKGFRENVLLLINHAHQRINKRHLQEGVKLIKRGDKVY